MSKSKLPSSRCPTHPGEILREDVLPSLKLTVTDAAKELGVARQTLHRVMTGEMAVTPAMALRLGRWCGNGPGLWLRMRVAYDLWHAERANAEQLPGIPSHVAA